MSGYGTAMRKAEKQRTPRPEVNTCGDCGIEITDSEILCQDCKKIEATRWEPIHG